MVMVLLPRMLTVKKGLKKPGNQKTMAAHRTTGKKHFFREISCYY